MAANNPGQLGAYMPPPRNCPKCQSDEVGVLYLKAVDSDYLLFECRECSFGMAMACADDCGPLVMR